MTSCSRTQVSCDWLAAGHVTQCSPLIGPEFLPREEFLRERSQQHEDIVWLRPHEISRPDEPILVSNKNEGFDVKQVYCMLLSRNPTGFFYI